MAKARGCRCLEGHVCGIRRHDWDDHRDSFSASNLAPHLTRHFYDATIPALVVISCGTSGALSGCRMKSFGTGETMARHHRIFRLVVALICAPTSAMLACFGPTAVRGVIPGIVA